ncbi:MAG: TonB-dependent receptor [Ignavibacteriae bacterium]|nr:MAG: TonB-dependent receptor [Ignavibacteriota bacterium]
MKLYRFIIFLILFTANIAAQTSTNNTIKGQVTTNTGLPLEYVAVIIEKLNISTTTDKNGNFEFTNVLQGNYLLTLKLTGYLSRTISINTSNQHLPLIVVLEESLIETPSIDVTGSFNAEDINNSSFSITSLSSRSLKKDRKQNLAQQIENIPGINNISTGTGIGKPVIRGLTSQSVLIIHDGVKQESQQWGDEHAPEISLFDIESIEILRGPASLVYGSDGIGGAINVISKPLEFSSRKKTIFYGETALGTESVNSSVLGNLGLGFGTSVFGLKGHFGYRNSKNVKTPEGTFNVNTPEGIRTIYGGELFNTASKEFQSGLNLGLNLSFGKITLGGEMFNREVQIHEDPLEDPNAQPNQKLNTQQYQAEGIFNTGKNFRIEPLLSYQFQIRKEFASPDDKENDITALYLKMHTFDGALRVHHDMSENINGTYGLSFTYQKNESLAAEKLIPNYNSDMFGIFIMEKFNFRKFSFSAGGRYDRKLLNILETIFENNASGNPEKLVNSQTLSFDAFSGSIGGAYSPVENINLFVNLGRGWRAPSEFELFVNGEHEGTGRYERGLKTINENSTPKPEQSLNLDAGIRFNHNMFSVQVSLFRNEINNFIYPSPTGLHIAAINPETGDTLGSLPVFDIKQSKSTFIGYEYNLQFQPLKWLILTASGDYVITKNEATGNALPFSPPMKNIIELKLQNSNVYSLYNPYFRFTAKFVSAQNEIDPLESQTGGYSLLGLGAGLDFSIANSIASLNISVDNLLNTKYTDHLSRYKYFAMNPGRNINLQVTVPFKF